MTTFIFSILFFLVGINIGAIPAVSLKIHAFYQRIITAFDSEFHDDEPKK